MSEALLFLREEDLRQAQLLLFLANARLAGAGAMVLGVAGLSRAQYRVLYLIGRYPGGTVSDLQARLGVSKQSLWRAMQPMLRQGLVAAATSRTDRRERRLTLSETGIALERRVFDAEREALARAFRLAGGGSVDGFRRVLRLLSEPAGGDTAKAGAGGGT